MIGGLRREGMQSRRGYSPRGEGGQGQPGQTRDTRHETRDEGFSRVSCLVSRVSVCPVPYGFCVSIHAPPTSEIPPPPRLPGWYRPLRIRTVGLRSEAPRGREGRRDG